MITAVIFASEWIFNKFKKDENSTFVERTKNELHLETYSGKQDKEDKIIISNEKLGNEISPLTQELIHNVERIELVQLAVESNHNSDNIQIQSSSSETTDPANSSNTHKHNTLNDESVIETQSIDDSNNCDKKILDNEIKSNESSIETIEPSKVNIDLQKIESVIHSDEIHENALSTKHENRIINTKNDIIATGITESITHKNENLNITQNKTSVNESKVELMELSKDINKDQKVDCKNGSENTSNESNKTFIVQSNNIKTETVSQLNEEKQESKKAAAPILSFVSEKDSNKLNSTYKTNFEDFKINKTENACAYSSNTYKTNNQFYGRLKYDQYGSDSSITSSSSSQTNDSVECHTCGKTGHLTRDCRRAECFKCGRHGHIARDCNTICFKCKEEGHTAKNCNFNGNLMPNNDTYWHPRSSISNIQYLKQFGSNLSIASRWSNKTYHGAECNTCGKTGHVTRDCTRAKCYKCGRSGHIARDCKTICFKCKGKGHTAKNCDW